MPGATHLSSQANSAAHTFCILIADGDQGIRETCKQAAEELGFMVRMADNFSAVLSQLSVRTDLVVLDAGLPGADPSTMLFRVKALQPGVEVVLTGEKSRLDSILEALKNGACDFLGKPFKNEEFMSLLQRVAASRVLAQEQLVRAGVNGRPSASGMIGQSAAMLRLYRIIERTASSKHPILILGEKGAGKSSLARMIHACGSLRDHPFVEVNCASPFSQLESALFAPSTMAMDQHALGVRGTVFLRAVAAMPLVIQGRLFRALQEKEIRQPDGGRVLPVEARVIAATDRDLDAAVQQGTFRRDLYLRLNVVALRLPPLRERREDIPMLAEHFLHALSQNSGVVFSMSPDTMKVMLDYAWPGNVRELEEAMCHAASASGGALITPAHLPPEMQTRGSSERAAPEAGKIIPLAEVERKAILDTLHLLHGNKQMAAQMLGIGKTTLYRKLKEYGIGRGSMDRHLRS